MYARLYVFSGPPLVFGAVSCSAAAAAATAAAAAAAAASQRANPRPFAASLPACLRGGGGGGAGGGAPDGCAVDVEGGVWSAVWGEGRVVRIVHGTVVGEVRVPARCVSCPRFVGDELWITSAGSEQQTGGDVGVWGGGLFRVGVGVRGREVGVWRGAVG
jgi:hypothetical protein